jgi:hypothetical protein
MIQTSNIRFMRRDSQLIELSFRNIELPLRDKIYHALVC